MLKNTRNQCYISVNQLFALKKYIFNGHVQNIRGRKDNRGIRNFIVLIESDNKTSKNTLSQE